MFGLVDTPVVQPVDAAAQTTWSHSMSPHWVTAPRPTPCRASAGAARLAAVEARLVDAVHTRRPWASDGYLSSANWLAATDNSSLDDARRRQGGPPVAHHARHRRRPGRGRHHGRSRSAARGAQRPRHRRRVRGGRAVPRRPGTDDALGRLHQGPGLLAAPGARGPRPRPRQGRPRPPPRHPRRGPAGHRPPLGRAHTPRQSRGVLGARTHRTRAVRGRLGRRPRRSRRGAPRRRPGPHAAAATPRRPRRDGPPRRHCTRRRQAPQAPHQRSSSATTPSARCASSPTGP